MCNTALDCLKGSSLRDSEGGGLDMDDSHDYNDENLRVKFLCSFSGSILPRPQDGKLRYVGGETRIVSVPHDIGYDDLMARMRELYEDAAILKYQQPDEDLDALVSVVNDEDVRNMMEEYDKLGSGDGFTRLRIFLFSYPDQDLSPHYLDGYERDNERRYVDALNSLSESPEYRRHQYIGSPVTTLLDDFPVADQFNSINLDGGVYGQRNFDVTIPQYYLRPLVVPNVASGHQSVAGALRYNEETSWSPSYYSPRYAGPNDPRAVPEVPHSPSSARYILPFAEVPDNGIDRAPDEYRRPEVNHQGQYAHQAQYSDNFVRLPPDQGGFPGNILQRPNGYDGHSICESCRMVLRRNQSARDFNRLHEEHPHMVQSSMSNGFPQAGDSCVECLRFQEAASLNADSKLQHGGNAEQIDPRSHYGETHASERWRHMCLHDQLNSRAHDPRAHMSGEGKVNDHCVIDGRQIGFPHGHNGLSDRHHMHMSHMHPNDRHCIPSGSGHEVAQEVYLGQAMAPGSIHVPFEEREAAHANLPFMYGLDDSHKQSHAQLPSHDVWQNVPTPVHVHFTSESNHQQRHEMDLPGSQRRTVEDNSRSSAGIEQNPQIGSSQRRMESDGHGTTQLDHAHNDAPNQHHGVLSEETHNFLSRDSDQNQSQTSDGASLESLLESMRLPETFSKSVCSSTVRKGSEPRSDTGDNGSEPRVETGGNNSGPRFNTGGNGVLSLKEESLHGDWSIDWGQPEDSDWKTIHDELESVTSNAESVTGSARLSSPNGTSPAEGRKRAADLDEEAGIALEVNSVAEFVASAKQSKRESVEVFKVGALEDDHAVPVADSTMNNSHAGERDAKNVDGNSETGSDDENHSDSKIEPTTAEEEAVARGLQTIRNEDLEEIRELGSGTYGSVYHGKWRGSDVAIKRIKASCFAGRPSERERLIADFWKEALILSSVHHPNVVSFYGVVRDGTDGSLATVTEFMVNGSLKQYLRKKDRTIDRRKRLILAMDAAFGMEYLHEKNIVHFDLKCENLLVNMRDPHRPVCKIGDLGLSKVKQRTLVSGGVRGTLPWMAPELLRGKSNMVTEKIDVYSFGIVMWELITGDEPYADMHGASIIGGIVNNTLRPQIPTWCDPEWKSLMENCWSDDPAERPSFSEISQRLRHMAAAMNLK